MRKKRARGKDGTFVKRDPDEEESESALESALDPPAAVEAPHPKQCRSFARKRMAEQMPGIVAKLIEETMGGSIAHAKVLLELTGVTKEPVAPKPEKKRGKSVVGTLLDEIAEIERQQQAKSSGDLPDA